MLGVSPIFEAMQAIIAGPRDTIPKWPKSALYPSRSTAGRPSRTCNAGKPTMPWKMQTAGARRADRDFPKSRTAGRCQEFRNPALGAARAGRMQRGR